MVQPYRHATQSGVTQVAYWFDVPMVVTDVGGLREIVSDGEVGYVTEPDPKAIATAIDRFYCEEKVRNSAPISYVSGSVLPGSGWPITL